MIDYIINLLISAGVLMLVAYILPSVRVKSFGTALWVAFLVGLLNVLIGWIFILPLDLVTLFLLKFVVRLIATAIVIKIVDKLVRDFEVRGFLPAIIIAIALAAASTLVDYTRADKNEYRTNTENTVYISAPVTKTVC